MKKTYFLRYSFLLLFVCLSNWVMAQTANITGKVTDDTNQPLPGATVLVKGTDISAATDVNGFFKITKPLTGTQTLLISFIGFETVTETINADKPVTLDIQLKTGSVQLAQVAVIGYGTVRKKDVTGSVDVLTSKEFNKGAVNTIQDALVGKLPGVSIISNSGAPGNTSTIRIRGITSLTASTDPLIVVDNVPLSNIAVGGTANLLSTINPDDIENITVLKDASATAIFGARGSSGVIMITTKRGGKKTVISYNATGSYSVLPKYVDVYTGDEYRALVRRSNYGSQTAVTNLLGTANTNWQKEIYKNAVGQDHNVSLSGTAKSMPYRVSVGYNNSDGVLKTYNFSRTTAALGLDPSLFKNTLNIHINLKGLYNTNNFADQAAIGSAVNYDPTKPVYNGNTKYRGYTTWTTSGNTDINGAPLTLATANPVARLNETDNTSTSKRSIGNVQFDYKLPFIPDLHANLNLGYDYAQAVGHNDVLDNTQWVYVPVTNGGSRSNYNTVNRNQLLDFYLNYKKDLKSIASTIDVTAGYSYSHFYTEGNGVSTDYSGNTPNAGPSPYKTEYFLVGYFGRLNYTFKDKYTLTVTVRDDATSKFRPDIRFNVFPATALAWRIKEENFLKNNQTISDLKLRVGYGITGQQDLVNNNNYPYQAKFSQSDASSRYQFGNTFYNTQRPEAYATNIKWESTATSNVGIDYGFLNGRFSGSIDVYYKKTSDLLNAAFVPALSNFADILLYNVGNLENKGFEANINAIVVAKKDLNWTLGYNISMNRNKVTKLDPSGSPDYISVDAGSNISGTTSGLIQANKIGYPIGSFYVYQQLYDTNGKPIEDGYVDRNKDGQINSSDLYFYKDPSPKVLMGINSSLTYKRIDFTFSGRLSLGNYNYNNVASGSTYRGLYSSLGYLSNQTKAADDTQFTNALQTVYSDYYIQDASFFRMDNMNLGYTFRTYAKKLKLHVSAGVQNAFVITSYKGLDPEISGGRDNNFFPRARIFQLGVNCNF